MNMRAYPLGHGNHNNVWMRVGLKGKISWKIVCFYDTQEAYVASWSVANTFPESLLDWLDFNKVYNAIKEALDYKDFKLITPLEEFLIKRNKFELEEFKENLYSKL